MKNIFKLIFSNKKKEQKKTGLDILLAINPCVLDNMQRADLTISCQDADYIPKVGDAGTIKDLDGKKYQIMHNGLLVKEGGYYGEWMTNIIKELKGHHEPQEEKVFFEVLKRLDHPKQIIELGAFWSYYSIWFVSQFKNAKAICVEPDRNNLSVGKENAEVNNLLDNVTFIRAAAGNGHGEEISFQSENESSAESIPLVSVDWLAEKYALDYIDIVHVDIQGFELKALEASQKSIESGKVRFLFVSTHHYSISMDPVLHESCLNWIKAQGGHIISDHNVLESFSGDGLIVASFDRRDKGFKVEVSRNTASNSLFRSYENDIALLLAQN